MKELRLVGIVLVVFAITLVTFGCTESESCSRAGEAAADSNVRVGSDSNGHPGTEPPEAPTCANQADCDQKCPPEALNGCRCDNGLCLWNCNSDADCPEVPGVDLVCDQGVCFCDEFGEQEIDIGGPPLCADQAECEAKCPSIAKLGCKCTHDGICAIGCGTDDDCPVLPGIEFVCYDWGVCMPPGFDGG